MIYVDGRPIPPCPVCGASIPRWQREELLDQAYRPVTLNTVECSNPKCEWGTTLEQLLVDLRPPRRRLEAA